MHGRLLIYWKDNNFEKQGGILYMYLVHSFIFYSSCTGLSIRGSTKYFYTQSFPIICQKSLLQSCCFFGDIALEYILTNLSTYFFNLKILLTIEVTVYNSTEISIVKNISTFFFTKKYILRNICFF
jgi:hypothetical protein